LHTVEVDPNRAAFARKWTAPFAPHVEIHVGDSREWLARHRGKLDVIYCDSCDVGIPGYQDVCLDEVRLAVERLHVPIVLVDDSPKLKGKGERAIPWLLDNGFHLIYSGQQALLIRNDVANYIVAHIWNGTLDEAQDHSRNVEGPRRFMWPF
jgi:hypothetical protein